MTHSMTCLRVVPILFLAGCVFDPPSYQAAVYARELQALGNTSVLANRQRSYGHLSTSGASPPAATIAAAVAEEETGAMRQLYGTNWGIGPAFLFGGKSDIESAVIVGSPGNERVHVTKKKDEHAIALLETHYFFTPGQEDDETPTWGHGPFLALGLAADDVIGGLGVGWMAGFLTGKEDKNVSFNIGLGAYLDQDVQRLGGGFKDGKSPPAGETSVRFQEEDEWRAMVLFSFRFSL